jgi:hypothetical protein
LLEVGEEFGGAGGDLGIVGDDAKRPVGGIADVLAEMIDQSLGGLLDGGALGGGSGVNCDGRAQWLRRKIRAPTAAHNIDAHAQEQAFAPARA